MSEVPQGAPEGGRDETRFEYWPKGLILGIPKAFLEILSPANDNAGGGHGHEGGGATDHGAHGGGGSAVDHGEKHDEHHEPTKGGEAKHPPKHDEKADHGHAANDNKPVDDHTATPPPKEGHGAH